MDRILKSLIAAVLTMMILSIVLLAQAHRGESAALSEGRGAVMASLGGG